MATAIDADLGHVVRERSRQNVYLCYQCKKCSSGCPLADQFDLTPAELVRALQFGQIDRVLRSRTMWLCSCCETCVTRCPMELDIPRLMDVLKGMAAERGIKPFEPILSAFNEAGIAWIKRAGRIHDVGLMAEVNLRLGRPFRDARMGLKMLRKGKIRLVPEWPGYQRQVPKPATKHGNPKRAGYFPGCTLHCSGSEYDESTRAVARHLGLELVEIDKWVCCGSGVAHQVSHELAAELPMKNLALAEAAGEDEVTFPCAACYSRFKRAAYDIEREGALKEHVAQKLGYEFKGSIKIKNILDTLTERVGLNEIEHRVIRPLKGIKAVCYYGCLYSRPVQVTKAVDAEYPMAMDRIVRRLGVQTLDWSYKTECCGASLMITQTDHVLQLPERILANARDVGAHLVVVACSFCHVNLDMHQQDIAQRFGTRYDIPILYFTQLMGLAFGFTPREMGLARHFTKADDLLQRLQLSNITD